MAEQLRLVEVDSPAPSTAASAKPDKLLVEAVRSLAARCDGAHSQDAQGFNGSDTVFGRSLAATPPETWGVDVQRKAWEMLHKYAGQLREMGLEYSDIVEPPKPATTTRPAGIRVVDVLDNHVIVRIPYGDSAYPKAALSALWNRDIRAWIVSPSKYGNTLSWAQRNDVPVSDEAQEFLSQFEEQKDYAGTIVLEHGEIVMKFDYNPSIVDAVRNIPIRRYNGDTKEWIAPASMIRLVRKIADEFTMFMTEDVKALPDMEVPATPTVVGVEGSDFALQFTYDGQLVSQMRGIPGAHWSAERRAWIVPEDASEEVLLFAEQTEATVTVEAQEMLLGAIELRKIIEASSAKDAEIIIEGLGGELMPFQRAGVAYVLRTTGWVFNEETREWEVSVPTEGGGFFGDEAGVGKGHPHGTKILTPKGWVNVENLSVGDSVIGSDGHATTITGVFPRGVLPLYNVSFNDGSSVKVDGDHIWSVQRIQNAPRYGLDRWTTKETRDLVDDVWLKEGSRVGGRKWRIPVVKPVHFDQSEELPLDPYLLGALLGNGGMSQNSVMFSTADEETSGLVRQRLPEGVSLVCAGGYDYRLSGSGTGKPNPVINALRELGLFGLKSPNKFVPEKYLYTSPEDRLALLRGLMDTDGYAGASGANEFMTSSQQLANDVVFLTQSLGGVARKKIKVVPDSNNYGGGTYYRVYVKLMDCPFLVSRKANSWVKPTKYLPTRSISSIEPCGEGNVTCISVDAPDQLYVTEHFIVTHNTAQALAVLHATKSFPAVIVCPATPKINWQRETNAWLPDKKVSILSGTSGNLPDSDVYVINYDILGFWLEKFITIKGVVFDESQYIKNGKAQRTKDSIRLSDKVVGGGMRLCLSGTFVVNRPLESMTQLRAIHRLDDFGGAKEYRKKFGGKSRRRHIELNRKLRATCYVRRRKIDVLKDLPPVRWAPIYVEGDPVVMREYRKAEADLIKYLSEIAESLPPSATEEERRNAWMRALKARSAENLVAISTLRQLAARAKMPAAREWIENFLDGDKKLSVWGWHRPIVDEVADKFAGGFKIQGGMSAKKKQESIDAFQTTDEQKTLSCNIKAAGVAITLTAASDCLFLEQGWTPGDMDQAVARCVVEGTLVMTSKGFVAIEDIRKGDKVLTHLNNWDAVTDTWSRELRGPLTTIKYVGGIAAPLQVTHDHLIFTRRGWVEAHQLLPSDEVYTPRPEWGLGVESILVNSTDPVTEEWLVCSVCGSDKVWARGMCGRDYLRAKRAAVGRTGLVKDWPRERRRPSGRRVRIPNPLPMSDDLCFVVGHYLAEGFSGIERGVISHSAHEKERAVLEHVGRYYTSLGISWTIYTKENSHGIELRAHSKELAHVFKENFGEGAWTKRIPEEWITQLSRRQTEIILDAYFGGDGYQRRNYQEWVTASSDLALTLTHLSEKMGYRACLRRGSEASGNHYIGGFVMTKTDGWRRIRSVFTEYSRGIRVYDLTTENDHSFQAGLIAVHNCHRNGQTDSVTGWVMMVTDTIDEDMAALISAKRVVVDAVTDGILPDEGEEDDEESMSLELMMALGERVFQNSLAGA